MNLLLKILTVATILTLIACCQQEKKPVLQNPVVEKIADGYEFTEGPLWIENVGLLFSDIPANKVYLVDNEGIVSEYISPSGKSNGLAIDFNGNLILCQHLARQVGIYINDKISSLASHFEGKKLNSPNDMAIHSSGTMFFTDPPFGLNDEGETSELGFSGIFSLTKTGKLHLLDKSLELPNGICFSPDETKLYVIDSRIADIYSWDVVNDSTLANKELFYDMDTQWGDGMKTDEKGFLYATAANGLSIFSPEGELVELVKISSSNASNCNWGTKNGDPIMYVTAGTAIYRLR